MSNTDSNETDGQSSDIEDYTDYYDLLGVPETAGEEEILSVSRSLLAEYHPDVSEHPNADELFKTINRAQDVLTDKEQRAIYDSLGHEQYVERRAEDGEMTLSEDFGSNGYSAAKSSSNNSHGDGTQSDSNASPSMSDVSADTGSTSRNEGNTWAGRIKNHGSYDSVTDFDLALSPKESVQKMYRDVWLARLAFTGLFGGVMTYTSSRNPEMLESVWASVGFSHASSLVPVIILFTAAFSVFVTAVSGGTAHRLLKPIADELTPDEEKQEEKRKQREKKRSRGLNTSVADSGGSSANGPSGNSGSAWDSHNRYASVGDENHPKQKSDERQNRAVGYGSRMLFLGILMTAFGSLTIGIHPWIYIQQLFRGGGEPELWWELGSESIYEIAVLLNAGYALTLVLFLVGGGLLAAHGLSREVWYARYFTKRTPLPFLWDSLVMGCAVVGLSGLMLGTTVLPEMPTTHIPSSVLLFLAAGGTGVTALSVGLAGFTGVWVAIALFRIRRSL